MTTNNLTEQLKKGELEEGYYYITNKAHSIKFNQIAYYVVYGETRYWTECEDEDVEEVLAPVPSFEEWQEMKEQRDACAWALDKIGDVLVKHKLVKKTDGVLK